MGFIIILARMVAMGFKKALARIPFLDFKAVLARKVFLGFTTVVARRFCLGFTTILARNANLGSILPLATCYYNRFLSICQDITREKKKDLPSASLVSLSLSVCLPIVLHFYFKTGTLFGD